VRAARKPSIGSCFPQLQAQLRKSNITSTADHQPDSLHRAHPVRSEAEPMAAESLPRYL